MQHYLVEILWNDPFPKWFSYRTQGSSFPIAVAKALRQFRKEQKGRRIKEGQIKFKFYGTETKA